MRKNRYLNIFACALTGVWVLFIWINSMQTGIESGAVSSSVTEGINAFLGSFIKGFELSGLFVRKTAHFLEFTMLSMLICFDICCVCDIGRSSPLGRKALVWFSLPCSAAVAAIDETIQLFVEGRVGSFTDVLIDCSGALCAAGVCFLILILLKRKPVA